MKILYLNHYAGSPALGMEYRPYHLAREWVKAGHEVQIVAADFSHVRSRQPEAGEQLVDGIRYRFYPTPRYRGNGFGRLRNIWAFLRQAWADAAHWAEGFAPQVVIASSTYPMDIWVARRIARKAGAKLVYEVHDLWPLSPIEISGLSRLHPFIVLCQAAEDAAYRDADRVVSMLPKVHGYMASRGLDLARLHIVANGIAPEDWTGDAEPLRADVAAAIARARGEGLAIVGYAGSMGLPNALDRLLDAAALPAARGLHVVLVGDGHERERLVRRATDEGLANVSFLPPIPKAQVRSFLAAIDIAYIGWQRVPIYRFGIAPNKLMDYMMAGCAVLHAVDAGNDPVAEAGCGASVAPDDAAAIAEALARLAALGPAARCAMGERGRRYVMEHHTWPVLARRFIEAVS